MPIRGHLLGHHWILDAADCSVETIGDVDHLERVLTGIPDALELVRVGPVQLFDHGEIVAGVVLISESHFSIHLKPNEAALHADLFSCRPVDFTRARELLREAYRFTRYEEVVLERGSK